MRLCISYQPTFAGHWPVCYARLSSDTLALLAHPRHACVTTRELREARRVYREAWPLGPGVDVQRVKRHAYVWRGAVYAREPFARVVGTPTMDSVVGRWGEESVSRPHPGVMLPGRRPIWH